MKIERKCDPAFNCIPLDEQLEWPRSREGTLKKNIVKKASNLINYTSMFIGHSRWLTWEEQTDAIKQESARGLKYASPMYASFFQLAVEPEKALTFNILDLPEITWNGEGIVENGMVYPDAWFEAYFLAVITRDKTSQDMLAKFPIERLKQSATTQSDTAYKMVEMFQSYHHRQDDFPKLLNQCMKMSNEQGTDWANYIAMGYLETFAALTTDIGFDFNEKLAKNLELQERYHINENEPHDRIAIASFLPIELLGMACMWHDYGNEVTVESDSLPRFLIEGTYFQ